MHNYPILIEYKGYKDKLVKLDAEGRVANKNSKNQPDYKTINSYAVNGAVHYANALLHYTSYTEIIAIGMTGHKDESGQLQSQIGVYYVSKSNFGVGQEVDKYLSPFQIFLLSINMCVGHSCIKELRHGTEAASGCASRG